MTVLVEIRCRVRSCTRLLDSVSTAPETGGHGERWTDWCFVHLCQRHGSGAGHGDIAEWQERMRREGKPTDEVKVAEYICWSELRPAVEEARRSGKKQVHFR